MDTLKQRLDALSLSQRRALEELLQQKKQKSAPIPRRTDPSAPARLSVGQRRLWFLQQLVPESTAYNLPILYEYSGQMDPANLQSALDALIQRHATLRTTFKVVEGEPHQIEHPRMTVPLQFVDLMELDPSQRIEAVQRRVADDLLCPFQIETGPLFRVTLYKIEQGRYQFSVIMHHMISDGWSATVIRKELSQIYQALLRGEEPKLDELPIQYADFARWQEGQLQEEAAARHLKYWQEKLAGAPESLNLPNDAAADGEGTDGGQMIRLEVDEALTAATLNLCRREQITPFMLLLACLKVVLSRWSGLEDIVVGVPSAGRTRREIEGLIGFFVNTLPLRTQIVPDAPFGELVQQVRETALEAQQHEELPFEQLLNKLNVERDLERSPIFQVFFNWNELADSKAVTEEFLPAELTHLEPEPKFDLSFYAGVMKDRLRIQLVYRRRLFADARMREMLAQIERLLQQVVRDWKQPVGKLSLVTRSAQHQLPDPTIPIVPPHHIPVTEQIEMVAREAPEAVAIRWNDRTWSYRQLLEAADRLAGKLAALGVKQGDVVAVQGTRSFGLICAILGVLRSRGVLLTIDPTLPADRKESMLAEAGAVLMVDVGSSDGECQDEDLATVRTVRAHSETGAIDAASTDSAIAPPHPEPDDPAYVFFTSGTTGVPKGILGVHRGLAHFMDWEREKFGVGADDRCSQLTGLSFDVVLRDIFLPLTSGASLCLRAADFEVSGADTVAWLKSEGITIMHTVPALAQFWADEAPGNSMLPDLRWTAFAGEPLTDVLVKRWSRLAPNSEIANLYGPTETTLAKCCYLLSNGMFQGVQPIGLPMPQTQALILSNDRRLCGIGELGEIVLRTPFRTLGYLSESKSRGQAFQPNPFAEDPRDEIYFTGDLGRYRPDGSLTIASRRDDQVKIRGVRVEPAGVAAVLNRFPQVETSVVLPRKAADASQFLAAYVVADQQIQDELLQFLNSQLPSAMVPSAMVFLDRLPRTPNGKVDRRALPEAKTIVSTNRTNVGPRNEIESQLAQLWRSVLDVESLGVHDNFFELGGHSLLAAKVAARLPAALHVKLPLRTVFEAPTIAQLGERVQDALRAHGTQQIQKIDRAPRDEKLPLSFSQQRFWFLDQLSPHEAAYNMPATFHIEGELDEGALGLALREIIRRHEVLRTVYRTVEGEPQQEVLDDCSLNIEKFDLSELPAEQRASATIERCLDECKRAFDLSAGPLVRATLFHWSDTEHLLLLSMHHVVGDGWSLGVILRELAALYDDFISGKAPQLAGPPIQYRDFAYWQRKWLQDEHLQSQIGYWKEQLEGIPSALNLPTDKQRPAVLTSAGDFQLFDLSADVTAALKSLGQAEGATLFMTLLAAYASLLRRYSGQEDLVIGVPVANRNQPELERLVGCFVNTLPLRIDLSGKPTFRQLLRRVADTALGAFSHQDVPFERLVEEVQPERNLSQTPIFQTLFVLQDVPEGPVPCENLSFRRWDFNQKVAKFDISLSLMEEGGRLRGFFEYNTDLFLPETIERFARHFENLLTNAVAEPEVPLRELSMLSPSERQQLLEYSHGPVVERPYQTNVIELFSAAARRYPDHVAVEEVGRQITYEELDAKSDDLAFKLVELGVGPEVPVGICVDRSIEMLVGVLGILKAGGAYVPLDPEYPEERLQFMLGDIKAPILLTKSSLLAQVPPTEAVIVTLDEKTSRRHRNFSLPNIDPDTLAYVIYTSGSTGTPKGVMIAHRAMTSFVQSTIEDYAINEADRVLQFASLNFDVSVEQIFCPLAEGATIVLRTDDMVGSASAFLDTCRDWGVTTLHLPTAYWHELLHGIETGDLDLPKSIRMWAIGGERASPERLRTWLERFGETVILFNSYGPTEATVSATTFKLSAATPQEGEVPIGAPLANTESYVLDKDLQLVPVGVVGELYLGGPNLARGYLNRPELTNERFIPHLFSDDPEARLYRTGDLVRWLPDGILQFLGRVDSQVKLRGYRIELGEVHTNLVQHPDIREAVITIREDNAGLKSMIAYVIPHPETEENVRSTWRDWLSHRLPEYMIPSVLVTLEDFPHLPNGKINVAALPSPDLASDSSAARYVAPRNPREETLQQIWHTVLGAKQVGVTDNFFEIGGHSLLVVRLIAQIEKRFQATLPVATVFQCPTIAEQAKKLENSTAEDESGFAAIKTRGSKPPFFFSGLGGGQLPRNLAMLLGEDQPFYAMLTEDLDNEEVGHATVVKMAERYVRNIREVQPHGPYYLGAFCGQGVIVYEAAQQLVAAGEEVAFLGMFESLGPMPTSFGRRWRQALYYHYQRTKSHTKNLSPLPLRGKVNYVQEMLGSFIRRRKHRTKNFIIKGAIAVRRRLGFSIPEKYQNTGVRRTELRTRYVAKPYSGRIDIFLGTLATYVLDPAKGWETLCQAGTVVHRVSGSHTDMLREPHVHILAETLKACLEEAQQRDYDSATHAVDEMEPSPA